MDKTRMQQYMSQMRAMFNKHALYSDESPQYQIPFEPNPGDTVKIRFRTLKNNVDAVYFISGSTRAQMQVGLVRNGFDYYEIEIPVGNEPIRYFFEIQAGRVVCYYNKLGVTRELQEMYSFGIIPGFHTPDWAKGAVMYQIYVDRFCNGDPTNDVLTNEYHYIGAKSQHVEDWYRYPSSMDVRDFYGGDLQGVLDKMDYLEQLGVEVIYFNPLFVSPSNHKYDSQDYDHVDPHCGKIVKDGGRLLEDWETDNTHADRYILRTTDSENLEASDRLLIRVIEEAHKRGIRVILDGVFNHCGSFNKWLDRERIYENKPGYEKGAYISEDSPYHDYFSFHDNNRFPYNPTYDGWWGHDTLPKLNYEGSRQLEDYILQVARKWVSAPFHADGWRLDVAADLGHSPEYNHRFWAKFRDTVKEANPHALIVAEHYGDPSSWLQGDQWDTVMNYDAFMEPVSWFLTGMEKHSDDYRQDLLGNADSFVGAMAYHGANMAMPSWLTAMNELSNHDHSRFLTRTNRRVGRTNSLGAEAANHDVKKAVLLEAVVMQMTWPGAPTVYYGDEAGVCGFTDPDNRRTYPWGREDKELIRFHRDIIRIHKENPALRTGSVKFLNGEDNLLCYGRFNREQQFVIIVNNDENIRHIDLSVWAVGLPEYGTLEQILFTSENGYSISSVSYDIVNGRLDITLPKHAAVILKRKNPEE